MMEFTCERSVLSEALASAARASSSRPYADGTPRGLHLVADQHTLTITGSDMDFSLTTSLSAQIRKEGSCLIDAKIITDIVRRLDGDEVKISVDNQYQAVISCDQSEFTIMALSAERYSALPAVENLRSVKISQADLKRLIGLTVFAVSTSESKGIHTGVLFDLTGDTLALVGLDGHRMALARMPLESEVCDFVVHAAPVAEIERLLMDDAELTVTLQVGRNYALFDLGHTQIVARLLEGEFLKYKNSIPSACTLSAVIDKKRMVQSVERVSLLINDKLKNPIRLKFSENNLHMSCATGLGKAWDILPVESAGELEIGFNNRYLLDALRHATDDTLRLNCNNSLSPMLLLPPEGDDYLFLILPVRLSVE